MLAQRRRQWSTITSALGQCIVLSGVSGAGIESVTRIVSGMQQSENTVQSRNVVLMSGQRRRLWVSIETALGECRVFAQSIQCKPRWISDTGNVLVPYHKKQISSGNLPADQPGLLLVDGHSIHESLAAIEMAKANNITIFCLPPHLTHLLQPLDVSYFRSLKSNWSREAETFGRDPRNEGKYVTKATFCRTFNKAWAKTIAKREAVTNGFRRCALFPFKRVSLADLLQDRLPPSHALHREADDDVPQLDEAGDAGIQIVDEGTRVSSEVGQTVDRGTWVSNEVGQTVDRGTRVSNEVGQTVDRIIEVLG